MTYTQFCREYYDRIFRIVRHVSVQDGLTWDPADHADICQELMIRFEKIEPWLKYPVDFDRLNWTYKWVRFAIRRWRRDQGRQDHATEHPLFSLQTLQEPIRKLDYALELSVLPPELHPILLGKLQGFQDSEIKGYTGMSKYAYDTGIRTIRNLLSPLYGGVNISKSKRAYLGKQPECDLEPTPIPW